MRPAVPINPVWSSASFLLYLGGLVVLVALGALLGARQDEHGDALFVLLSALVLAAVAVAANALLARDREIAAGIFAVITVAALGVFAGALLEWIGLLDTDPDGFDSCSWPPRPGGCCSPTH